MICVSELFSQTIQGHIKLNNMKINNGMKNVQKLPYNLTSKVN